MIAFNWDKGFFEKFFKAAEKPIEDLTPFWSLLTSRLHQDTSLAFKTVGARNGHQAWKELSEYTLHPVLTRRKGSGTFIDMNKWRVRIGTDNRPHGKYSENSNKQILKASGAFEKSFGVIKTQKDKMTFGTNHHMAKDIMSSPERQVLFITAIDKQNYSTLFKTYMRNQYSKMVV